ncbi:MAG: hypothetical protein HY788_10150 [Deltaproteobacteria bacterium]|nr:hypothetical protein [Deltaproteobacteria bacterium]
MNHRFRFLPIATVVAGLILTGAICLSRWISAAEAPDGDGTLFAGFVSVLRDPRCLNCHSDGDFPRQGDDGHQHTMNIRRGPDGEGVTAQKCGACHQEHNLAGAHMPPGAPHWRLPAPEMPMIWQGLTDARICRSIKDPEENGDRTVEQIVDHLANDRLVLWGWNPGEGRDPVPMPHDEFVSKVKQWRDAGAPCPADSSEKVER